MRVERAETCVRSQSSARRPSRPPRPPSNNNFKPTITINGLSVNLHSRHEGEGPRLKLDLNIVNYLSLIRGLAKWGRFMEYRSRPAPSGARAGDAGSTISRGSIYCSPRRAAPLAVSDGPPPDPTLNRNHPRLYAGRLMRCYLLHRDKKIRVSNGIPETFLLPFAQQRRWKTFSFISRKCNLYVFM